MLSSPKRAEAVAVALVAFLVVGNSLRLRPRLLGDGAEYFVVAEAFARHASPDLRAGDREAVWSRLAEEEIEGAEHVLEVPAVEAFDGRIYAIHFWGYPLATLPARLVLRLFGVSVLKAPQVTNALLFTTALGFALFRSPLPALARRTFAALCLLSPALWFVVWPHPEVFSFSFVTLALVWRAAGRLGRATAAAAVASVQNPPLMLLALALWVQALRASFGLPAPHGLRRAVGATLASLPAAVPSAFYMWGFGTPSLLMRGAIDASNLSVGRTLELLVDLNLGLLPYAPFVFVASLWGLAVGGPRWSWSLVLAMAYLCTATSNWNSGTSGPARYVVWMYPLVLDSFVGLLAPRDSSEPSP